MDCNFAGKNVLIPIKGFRWVPYHYLAVAWCLWHVIGDMWYVTCDTGHVTHGIYHLKHIFKKFFSFGAIILTSRESVSPVCSILRLQIPQKIQMQLFHFFISQLQNKIVKPFKEQNLCTSLARFSEFRSVLLETQNLEPISKLLRTLAVNCRRRHGGTFVWVLYRFFPLTFPVLFSTLLLLSYVLWLNLQKPNCGVDANF